jgi:four helix bundle protein
MKVSEPTANETDYWLSLLKDTEFIKGKLFESVQAECKELIAMLVATVKTSKK